MQLAKRRDLPPQKIRHKVVEEWNKIPSQTCMAMYHSIKKRLQACIANKGGEPNIKKKLTKVIVL